MVKTIEDLKAWLIKRGLNIIAENLKVMCILYKEK